MKKKKFTKVRYYTDPIHDDFAENITKPYQITDDFKFIHKSRIFRFLAFILYHIIAVPVLWCIVMFRFHVRVHNKKAIKRLKGTGYFVYMNHTQNTIDAYINQVLLFKNKGHIICSNDVYSLFGLNTVVNMLGALPIANNMIQSKKLYDAITHYINKKDVIVILPEAHVWPYYNDIRPFLSNSFIYPVTLNKPIIVTTVVYRQRKIFKHLHPYISLYVSDPIFPKFGAPVKDNQEYLRDEAYEFMKKMVTNHKSFEYIKYVKKK